MARNFRKKKVQGTGREHLDKQGGYRMYRKFRSQYMAEHPLCERCLKKGIIKVAKELHHIVKARVAPMRILDPTNVESLCKQCHRDEHRAETSVA